MASYALIGRPSSTFLVTQLIKLSKSTEQTHCITDTGIDSRYYICSPYYDDDVSPYKHDKRHCLKPVLPVKTHPYQLCRKVYKSVLMHKNIKKNRSSNKAIGWR